MPLVETPTKNPPIANSARPPDVRESIVMTLVIGAGSLMSRMENRTPVIAAITKGLLLKLLMEPIKAWENDFFSVELISTNAKITGNMMIFSKINTSATPIIA